MTAATLRPCPFCGAQDGLKGVDVYPDLWLIQCTTCGADGPIPDNTNGRTSQSFDDAVNAWNTRCLCA
jgi:Lar family restriction alleviation protein